MKHFRPMTIDYTKVWGRFNTLEAAVRFRDNAGRCNVINYGGIYIVVTLGYHEKLVRAGYNSI